jgi:thioredoxin 1
MDRLILLFFYTKMASIHISNKEDFTTKVIQSQKPVLVDFYADWCGPCKIMGPILEEIASETPGVVVAKVDVDASSDIAVEYNISSIPTFIMFVKGAAVGQSIGAVGKAQIKKMIAGATQ